MAEFADQPQILSVTQLNRYVKGRLDSDPYLGSVAVRGELSNYTKHTSGHHYFTLKDANGVLKCIMYASSVRNLRFVPEVGMQVIAFGYVSVFPRDGRYQLYVDMMAPDGVGAVNAAFEHLRARLEKEGLFAPERKKPIPAYPKRIALITSPVGDAVRDMIRILGVRQSVGLVVELVVAPGAVGGRVDHGHLFRIAADVAVKAVQPGVLVLEGVPEHGVVIGSVHSVSFLRGGRVVGGTGEKLRLGHQGCIKIRTGGAVTLNQSLSGQTGEGGHQRGQTPLAFGLDGGQDLACGHRRGGMPYDVHDVPLGRAEGRFCSWHSDTSHYIKFV